MSNLTKGGSLGGGLGAVYSHNGTEDTNPFRTGDSKKKIQAVVGAMVGAAAAKQMVGDSGITRSIIIGSVSAISAGALSGQIGVSNFKNPAIVTGACSTIGDLVINY